MRYILLFLAALLAAICAPVAAGDSQSNDRRPSVDRIVAIGDLHGDHDNWLEIAREAGLIDRKARWTGGRTILVQLGDLTDRGPASLQIIRDLQRLTEEARTSGGDVIVLLGNHEAMNVTGDLRYVHDGEYDAFRDRNSQARRQATWDAHSDRIEEVYRKSDPELTAQQVKQRWFGDTPLGMLEHRRAWIPGGEIGEWASTLNAVVQIGNTLFVHGGLSEEATRASLEEINDAHRMALSAQPEVDRTILTDPLGPLWYRGNVRRAPPAASGDGPRRLSRSTELELVLNRFEAKRLVVAHTPSPKGIATDLGGRLVRVDTGISSYYGGPLSFLEIVGDDLIAHEKLEGEDWTARPIMDREGGE